MRYTIVFSSVCEAWLAIQKSKDVTTYRRLLSRIQRMETGNFGDAKSVGGGVSELRLDFGPGYRLYFTKRGTELIIVLCGGNKMSQAKDIDKAKQMARALP